MIDRKWIGYRLPARSAEVEKGQIILFCKAIGETRPIHVDIGAARAAGYRGLVAPPTFGMCLDMIAGKGDMYTMLAEMGMDLGRGVHGEQGFTYHGMIFSGDVITFTLEVLDIYEKKNGALEFIATRSSGVNQHGELVVELRNIAVGRR
jgi:acyl dehydratase